MHAKTMILVRQRFPLELEQDMTFYSSELWQKARANTNLDAQTRVS
jgi:hypothetical protein